MPRLTNLIVLAAAAGFVALAAANIVQAASTHEGPGDCGEYRYWHNGHCVDARTKPGKDWTAGVYF
jgi:hypothetical protein